MALMAGNTVKRKANVLSSSSRKKAKTQQLSANDLPWKTVSTRQEAGIDSEMNGIMELEEVDGVEVVYEQTDNGRVVRFNVRLRPFALGILTAQNLIYIGSGG